MSYYNEKNKLMCVLQDLQEMTDETHSLNSTELIEQLRKRGLKAERRSIYAYIDALRDVGYDICLSESHQGGYYINSRDFDNAELKLLIDAVQASRFISRKKSRELVDKLCGMTSHFEAGKLREELYVVDRVKSANEHIYYNVDMIHRSMIEDKKIRFQYYRWNMNKELEAMHGGANFVVSPWLLVWEDGNYYMIAVDDISKSIKYYRIDKMRRTEVTNFKREGQEIYREFNPSQFAKRTFNMWGEEPQELEIECLNSHVGVILDRFGTDVIIVPENEDTFRLKLKLCAGEHFFGWVVSLGGAVRIVWPSKLVNTFEQYLCSLLSSPLSCDIINNIK